MFDKNEELITVVDPEYLLESEQTQELNGLITTIVSAPYSKELESAFYIGSRDIDDNNIFWLYKVDKRTKENNNIILNGTYSLFDDLKAYDVIRDKRPSNVSALVGINTVLEGSRWQVGNITSTHTGTANWYYVSRLEAFWEYLENWNVEFKPRMTFSKGKITGRYIDIVDKLSDDYGKWYEYGDKLLQVTAEQASDSLYTAFIGRGKGEESGNGYGRRIGFEKVVWTTASGKPVDKPLNQDYVEIPSATELYGYSDGKPRMTVVIFEDTEDAAQVLQQTYDYALNECRPKLQLKANVLEDGVSELGETCTIIRDDRGIRYKTRVFKLTRNFLNKKQRTAEFGDEIVQSTAKRNSNTGKEIKKQEDRIIYWLDSLRQELVDSYFNEDGYNYDLTADNEYDLPAGYYSFDRPIDASPTKVIYMGAGKLMIANSKNPDGQWNWTTAINGDGANLSAVNTGLLQAGRIQSAVDGSFWDLDNGLMDLKSGTLTGNQFNLDLGLGVMKAFSATWGMAIYQGGRLDFALGDYGVGLDPYKIQFTNSGWGKTNIRAQSEGLLIRPELTNTGTGLNSSFHLAGNVSYVQFNNLANTLNRGRLEYTDDTTRVRTDNILSIMGLSGTTLYKPVQALSFYTYDAENSYNNMQMIGNRIQMLNENSNQNIYITPSLNGKVVIGKSSEAIWYNLECLQVVQKSTREIKDNIIPYHKSATAELMNLTVVEYDLKQNLAKGIDDSQVGFIAEDSHSITDKEGKGIDLGKVGALNTKAIQEVNLDMSNEIRYLKAELSSLKDEMDNIKQQLGLS